MHCSFIAVAALQLIFLAGIAAGQCDSSGACSQAVAGSVSGSAAPSQCSSLPNASWTIASMIDSVTQQSIQQRCFNTVPSGQAFWIGLYDSRCCNQRTPSGAPAEEERCRARGLSAPLPPLPTARRPPPSPPSPLSRRENEPLVHELAMAQWR